MKRMGRTLLLLLHAGAALHVVACSGDLRVELVNKSGSACVVEISQDKPLEISGGATGAFSYISASARGLTIRSNTTCWEYTMPAEFASSHDRQFVRPEGFVGRVARMSLDGNGLIRILAPEADSTTVNATQPVGFPARPTECTRNLR
jgi:hypothetical protein